MSLRDDDVINFGYITTCFNVDSSNIFHFFLQIVRNVDVIQGNGSNISSHHMVQLLRYVEVMAICVFYHAKYVFVRHLQLFLTAILLVFLIMTSLYDITLLHNRYVAYLVLLLLDYSRHIDCNSDLANYCASELHSIQ